MTYIAIAAALFFPTAAVTLIILAIVLKNDLPRPGVLILAQGYRTRKTCVDTSLTVTATAETKKGNQPCN